MEGAVTIVCASVTQTRPGTGEKGQAAKKIMKFLSHFYGPKRNRRSVKFASKRFMSVYRDFLSRCTLNFNRISRAGREEKRQRMPDHRFNYRKKKTSAQM